VPQPAVYQKALEKMDFSAAADYYLRPWTHNYMDIVLPAAMTYEKCTFRYIRAKDLSPGTSGYTSGEARPDWRICCELGTALDIPKNSLMAVKKRR
jgi:predicted molibdopterin-dependent oxidoreductase YjgC